MPMQHTKQVSFRMTVKQHKDLQRIARLNGRPINQVLQLLVRQHIDDLKADPEIRLNP